MLSLNRGSSIGSYREACSLKNPLFYVKLRIFLLSIVPFVGTVQSGTFQYDLCLQSEQDRPKCFQPPTFAHKTDFSLEEKWVDLEIVSPFTIVFLLSHFYFLYFLWASTFHIISTSHINSHIDSTPHMYSTS